MWRTIQSVGLGMDISTIDTLLIHSTPNASIRDFQAGGKNQSSLPPPEGYHIASNLLEMPTMLIV